MSLVITEELIARQPPEAQAIIRFLLAQNAELRAEIETLRTEIAALKKTPTNSSRRRPVPSIRTPNPSPRNRNQNAAAVVNPDIPSTNERYFPRNNVTAYTN